MIVKCITKTESEDLINRNKTVIESNRDYHVTIGRSYLVYGLQFNADGSRYIDYFSDSGNLAQAPFDFFKVQDGKISMYWQLKVWENNDITLWPSLFYQEFFHDDLSEAVEEVVKDFKELTRLLEEEQSFNQSSCLNNLYQN
jgi:hypothetical protein